MCMDGGAASWCGACAGTSSWAGGTAHAQVLLRPLSLLEDDARRSGEARRAKDAQQGDEERCHGGAQPCKHEEYWGEWHCRISERHVVVALHNGTPLQSGESIWGKDGRGVIDWQR